METSNVVIPTEDNAPAGLVSTINCKGLKDDGGSNPCLEIKLSSDVTQHSIRGNQ